LLLARRAAHTHPVNGPLSRTTRVSRYQKGKTSLDFTEARGSEWQWHQLGHMQVCTLLQTDNHASTSPLSLNGCSSRSMSWTAANPPQRRAGSRVLGQTDGRTLYRFIDPAAYYASSVNYLVIIVYEIAASPSAQSIRCQKTLEVGIRRIPAYTPPIHHWTTG